MTYPRLIDDGSVWIVAAPPLIWAAHFLLSYGISAVWCAGDAGALAPVRWTLAGLTLAALAGLGAVARVAVRGYGGGLAPGRAINRDADADRAQFLGHVALLLCVLSAVATVFTALPVAAFARC